MNKRSQRRSKHLELEPELEVPLQLFLEGYDFNRIAIQLEIPVGEVKKRIFSARKSLTESFS